MRSTRIGLMNWIGSATVCLVLPCQVCNAQSADLDPVHRGNWPGFRRGRANHVVVKGNYAYVTTQTGLQVIDISDPSNPQSVGGTAVRGELMDREVGGDFLHVTAASADLQVIDVTDPRMPQRVGSYAAHAQYPGVEVVGGYLY